jgi:16S rRNA processing protein RimM
MAADAERDRIFLGRIAGAHGIRGEVIIHAFTEPPENVAAYGPLSDASGARTYEIENAHATPKGVVARLAGVADRTAAEALKGVELYVARDRLPVAAEGEFYHADLIGLAAVDAEGTRVGEIVAVPNYGAGDLLEIRLAGARQTELIPFTDAHVPKIDVAAGRAVVVLPPPADAARGAQSGTQQGRKSSPTRSRRRRASGTPRATAGDEGESGSGDDR